MGLNKGQTNSGSFKKGIIPFMKGKHHSLETREKISKNRKGRVSWNKNLITPISVREKQRQTRLIGINEGRIKVWNKGLNHNIDKRLDYPRRGLFKKRNIPWNKGLNKLIDKRVGNISHKLTNKHLSKERFEKLQEGRKKAILPIKDTSIEVKIQNFLKQMNVEFFTHQYMKEIEHGYQCDVLIPSMNLVIECDGDYWHKYPIGRDIDHIRTKELLEKGFKVLRLWEFEINKMTIDKFKEKLYGK